MKKGIMVLAIALATSVAAFAAQNDTSADQLADLKLTGAGTTIVLDQRFNPEQIRYTAVVDSGVEDVLVAATPADASAKVAGEGLVKLAIGDNDIPVTVTNADGSAVTYKVRVTRNLADMSSENF
jgi:hypothetical protein